MARPAINLEADIQPVSDFRARTSSMLDQVKSTGRPLILTQRGRGAAVVVDIHAFQALIDELDTLRDLQSGLADVEDGRTIRHDHAKKRLTRRFAKRH
jgi:prevent-host-death family protein